MPKYGNYESEYLEWVLAKLGKECPKLSVKKANVNYANVKQTFINTATNNKGILINAQGHWFCAYKYKKDNENSVWWIHDSLDTKNVHLNFLSEETLFEYLKERGWTRCIFIA